MTVTTNDRRLTYPGNGVATVFPGPRIFDADDLDVYEVDDTTGSALLKVSPTYYTVTGVTLAQSTVTLVAALPAGKTLLLLRTVPYTQTTRFRNQGSFFPELHEDEFDRAAMRDQQMVDVIERSARFSDTYLGGASAVFPDPVALYFLRFNAAADGLEAAPAVETVFTQDSVDAVPRTHLEKLRDTVSAQDFGAVGDGVTDDTAALQAAIDFCIDNGLQLHFGDESRQYRITDTISRTNGNVGFHWRSDGAGIFFDPATVQREVFSITVTGGDHFIQGRMAINANRKAHIGIYLYNTSDGSSEAHYGSVVFTDLSVSNIYRASTTHTGGDGLWIRGAWSRVLLTRIRIKGVAMAAGAGILGSQGISGITVSNNGAASFRYCSISDAVIDGVYSEDPAYTVDQDGIRLFDGGEDVTRLYPWESMFDIRGGHFRNCWGRSIKSQGNYGTVRGCKFYRDQGNSTGVGNPEIDFQVGGGSVSDTEHLYIGHVPSVLFQGTGTATAGKQTPLFRVRGVSVVVTPGSAAMVALFGISAATLGSDSVKAIIGGVDASGANVAPYVAMVRGRGTENLLMLSDIVADPSTSIARVWLASGAVNTTTRVFASNVVNTGADVDFVARDTDANRFVIGSAINLIGVVAADAYNSAGAGAHPGITRVDAIGPSTLHGSGGTSGLVRPVSFALANNAEYVLPNSAYASNHSGIVIVTVGSSIADQGIFSVSSAGALAVTGIGAGWTVGGVADPGAGNWRIWGTAGGIVIKNASGTSRQVTALMIG